MVLSKLVRSAGVCSLGLLVLALANGVPTRGHTHHDSDQRQVGAPEHAHGMALVQYEMRFERSGSIVFLAVEAPPVDDPLQAPIRALDPPTSERCTCESRAPPDTRPRAPPL